MKQNYEMRIEILVTLKIERKNRKINYKNGIKVCERNQ